MRNGFLNQLKGVSESLGRHQVSNARVRLGLVGLGPGFLLSTQQTHSPLPHLSCILHSSQQCFRIDFPGVPYLHLSQLPAPAGELCASCWEWLHQCQQIRPRDGISIGATLWNRCHTGYFSLLGQRWLLLCLLLRILPVGNPRRSLVGWDAAPGRIQLWAESSLFGSLVSLLATVIIIFIELLLLPWCCASLIPGG